jgi:hypothetical protein
VTDYRILTPAKNAAGFHLKLPENVQKNSLRLPSIGVIRKMILIRNLVQQALSTGYLTIEAEEQLRRMLATKYELEDLEAFMTLQQAAMIGEVKQQSRELLRSS